MSFLKNIKAEAGAGTSGSFTRQMRATAEKAAKAEPESDRWERKLKSLKGVIGHDGIERISFNDVCDALEVPMKMRPNVKIRLSRVMGTLGWSNIRARNTTQPERKCSLRVA